MTNKEFILMLSEKYYRRLYLYVRQICPRKDLAEDIVQEVMLTAYQKADDLKHHDNIKGWLYQTARYKMLHMVQENISYEELDSLEEMISDGTYFEEKSIASLDLTPEIMKYINKDELDLMLRHYEDGYAYVELAEEYSTSWQALKSKAQRIRKKLKKVLRGYLL
jgi:RNA polymerase sigma factor (sigma-70 family)